jgi:MFS family permease
MIFSFSKVRTFRFAVSCFFFMMGFTFSSWANRIPEIKNKLHLSDAGLGGVLFALPIGQFVAMMLSGYLVSKFSSKKTLIFAALIYTSILPLLGLVNNVWQLMACLFLFGMSGNLCGISINTQGVGVERLYRRSIMASFHGLWSLAGFTGGIVSAFMISNNIIPFVHFCIVYIFTFIIIISMHHLVLPRDSGRDNTTRKRIFVKPDSFIITLGMIAFGSMICEGTMFDWSGVYFEKIIHPPKELVRLGYVAFMFTMASGRFAGDWLVTRFGITRILQMSGIIISSGLLIAVLFPYIATATIGFLLVGIGTSSVVPLCYSLAGKSKNMLPGYAIASVASVGFLGFLIGPPVIGFISEMSNLRWSFSLISILGLITTLLASRIKL